MERKRYEIGYTAGVFDMFHVGHVNLLRNAKGLCEKLVVGVSNEDCVVHKGKLPVICLEDRMAVVQACRWVDGVVVQDELDKYKAWEWLHYDVLVSGDDWKGVTRWKGYERALREDGADVVYFPYTKGVSSSIIRNSLKENGKEKA